MTENTQEPQEQELSNLATALCKAQGIMAGAKKDKKNPFFKSTYADLSSVFDAIREPFSNNGLSVTQTLDILENGKPVLCTRLMHISGESISSRMLLPEEPNPQKLGSLLTYYRRYSLMAIAGIPAEDDDGNAASRNAPTFINKDQISILETLINGNVNVRDRVLENCNGDFGTITTERFPGALQWIKKLLILGS